MKLPALTAALVFSVTLGNAQPLSTTDVRSANNVGSSGILRVALQKSGGDVAQPYTVVGAKFDALTITDVTTVSASKVVTSAGQYAFTTVDIGKAVNLWAGSMPATPNGTITSGSVT